MIVGASLAVGTALVAFALSGARRWSYLLFYLAFIPFLTLDPSRGGLVSVDGIEGGNVAWKLGVRAATALALVAIAFRRRAAVFAVLARPTSLPVIGLVAWAIVGLPGAQDPWVSFFRLGELALFFLTGVVLYVDGARHARPLDVVRWHALALVPVLVVASALALLDPALAFHESSSGIQRMGHKLMNSNVLGFAAAVVLLWSTFALRQRVVERTPAPGSKDWLQRLVEAAAFALAAYVLFHARSRTATLTALGGQAILWFPWPDSGAQAAVIQRRRLAFAAALVTATCLTVACWPALESWFLRGADIGDVTSGTGRTGLWHDLLLEQVPEAPLVGAGYLNLSAQGGFEHAGHAWNNAHNTYLFALVSMGLPGLACVLSVVALPWIAALRRALGAPSADRGAWTLVFALQSISGVAGVTGFGVAGFPSVAMLFHYGLYAFVCAPAALCAASSTSPRVATPSAPLGGRTSAASPFWS